MSLIAAAMAFGYGMARLRIPARATEWLRGITDNHFLLLVLKMGMDPIHFGIMMLLNLAIGLCTPPVGSALFLGSAIGKISIRRATRGCLPFYVAMLVALMLVSYIPAITVILPNLVMSAD